VLEKIANPLGFSKSLGSPRRVPEGRRADARFPAGRPGQGSPEARLVPEAPAPDALSGLLREEPDAPAPQPDGLRLEPLVAEWLRDLQIQGRSQQTIDWYRHKLRRYLAGGGVTTLDKLTGFELKRHLAQLQQRRLSSESVHGHFAALRAFAGWAARENYTVDPSFFRVRPRSPRRRWRPTPRPSWNRSWRRRRRAGPGSPS
jgi:hypothetical protein